MAQSHIVHLARCDHPRVLCYRLPVLCGQTPGSGIVGIETIAIFHGVPCDSDLHVHPECRECVCFYTVPYGIILLRRAVSFVLRQIAGGVF